MKHPRDRFITVYGRKPVLEVLEQSTLPVRKLFLARSARGDIVKEIRAAAKSRGVEISLMNAEQVSRISRRPKQDQGVAADVEAAAMGSLEKALPHLPERASILALDGVTTPANVGMILRSATVLGLDGIVLPRRGCPEIGPLVIKASAGVAFRAKVLRCATIEEGLEDLRGEGFRVFGLSDRGDKTLSETALGRRTVFVLGNESVGVSEEVAALIDGWVQIPMAAAGDSLNVACAAAIVCHHLATTR